MAIYYFYSKYGRVIAVEKDISDSLNPIRRGYIKEFEEVEAFSSQAALKRFHDIRDEQEKSLWAFATGPIFFAAIALVAYLLFS